MNTAMIYFLALRAQGEQASVLFVSSSASQIPYWKIFIKHSKFFLCSVLTSLRNGIHFLQWLTTWLLFNILQTLLSIQNKYNPLCIKMTIQGGKPRVSPRMSSVSQIPRYNIWSKKRGKDEETDFISRKIKYSRFVKKKRMCQSYIMLFLHFILKFG